MTGAGALGRTTASTDCGRTGGNAGGAAPAISPGGSGRAVAVAVSVGAGCGVAVAGASGVERWGVAVAPAMGGEATVAVGSGEAATAVAVGSGAAGGSAVGVAVGAAGAMPTGAPGAVGVAAGGGVGVSGVLTERDGVGVRTGGKGAVPRGVTIGGTPGGASQVPPSALIMPIVAAAHSSAHHRDRRGLPMLACPLSHQLSVDSYQETEKASRRPSPLITDNC